MAHKIVRNNDEYACSCGLTWAVDEDDPHEQNPRIIALNEIKELFNETKPLMHLPR